MNNDVSNAGIIAGTKVLKARKKAGMDRAELGDALQMQEDTIRGWEHDGLYNKILDRIIDLHIALDAPLWSLLPTERELGLKTQ